MVGFVVVVVVAVAVVGVAGRGRMTRVSGRMTRVESTMWRLVAATIVEIASRTAATTGRLLRDGPDRQERRWWTSATVSSPRYRCAIVAVVASMDPRGGSCCAAVISRRGRCWAFSPSLVNPSTLICAGKGPGLTAAGAGSVAADPAASAGVAARCSNRVRRWTLIAVVAGCLLRSGQ